jgi:peptidoglycan hydrolase CwlO-like protein
MERKTLAVFLSFLLILAVGTDCLAQTTQEQINSKKAEQRETKANYQTAQKTLESLRNKKNDQEAYLTELNSQMEELKETLAKLERQYNEKQDELQLIQADLADAEVLKAQQYEDMKLRIQYMYENGESNYMELLFSAESLADFLNKADQISAIAEYDRKMLEEYEKTVQMIEEKELQAQEEEAAIAQLQSEYEEKEEEVALLVEDTYIQIREYEEEIEDSKSEISKLLSKISSQENDLNALIKKQKDEQAAAALAKRKAEEEKKARQAAASGTAAAPTKKKPAASSSSGSSAPPQSQDSSSSEGSSSGSGSSGKYLGRFKLTAYCPCESCCGKADGITASGTKATQGRTVAMGGVPLGTKLNINGTIYVVEDRGTVYGHVDIFKNSHQAAMNFGVHYADVYQVG